MKKYCLTQALLFFLSDVFEDTVLEYQYQDLNNANPYELAKMIVNVWKPFENYTVSDLLAEIDKLAEKFEEVYSYAQIEIS